MSTDLLQLLRDAEDRRRLRAMATLVRVDGSAFRAPGARMFLTDDGHRVGDISGGCLDDDVARRAGETLGPARPELLSYDADEVAELASGFATGCPRRVEILLQHFGERERQAFDRLQAIVERREIAMVGCVLDVEGDSPLVIGDIFVWSSGDLHEVMPPQLHESLGEVDARLRSGPGRLEVELHVPGGRAQLFAERIDPPVRLLLFGGGSKTVEAIRTMSAPLGWEIVCIDGGGTSHDQLERLRVSPEALTDAFRLDARSAALVLTHHETLDRRWIEALLPSEIPYIGVLGSRRRLSRLLGSWIPSSERDRIHGPIGLDLGGSGAHDMALSIVAEIQGVLQERTGRKLRRGLPAFGTAVLLLAAGESSRMGEPKQLLRQGDETLLRRAATEALASGARPVCVVLGSQAERMERELEGLDVQVCMSEDWREGMGSSIAAGVRALRSESSPERVLIMLCDQPAVHRGVLRELMALHASGEAQATACEYAQTLGVPAIFDASLFDELEALRGEAGARNILRALQSGVNRYAFPGGAIDIDRIDDLRQD